MQKDTAKAFGKLERDDDGAVKRWHPLIDHLIDVAACFEYLCRCRSIRRALESAAQRKLQPRDIARLAVLVFLHDLGKANSGFQAKRWRLKGDIPLEWPSHAGHGIEATKLFSDDVAPLVEKLPIESICAWGEAVDSLLKASISHHGRPITENSADWNRAIWQPVRRADGHLVYDPGLVLQEMGERLVALYPEAFEIGGEPLPDAPAFGHLFAGLVQLADWLGSDTRFFKYSREHEDRATTAPCYAAKAVAALGLDGEAWQARLNVSTPTFAQTFGIDSPYPVQAAMDDLSLGPLVILESETGSGKTEAALWRFVHLFRAGAVDSLYFALPTRVSASQLYQRVCSTVQRLWPTDAPVVVRALPGYVSADGHQAQALPDFKVLWSDRPDDKRAHRRWAAESPKRFLAAPIAVGTIDQALLGALQVRHAHLRHALLARSLLVVDEVHASDPYMTVLLERLLKAHLGCGGHALLLSATLGSSARDRYLALAPQSEPTKAKGITAGFEAACAVPYPAISDFSGARPVASASDSKTVSWRTLDIIDEPESIAGMAFDAAAQGAKVLVIRNTVPAAVAVLKAIEASAPDPNWLFTVNGISTLHHSHFSRQDRPILDKAIEAQLGKKRADGPCIVVGTQTLEQSLDLDADVLITDLCPMDVLLQRVGRLHRHTRPDKQRPMSFRTAQAWVLIPKDNDLSPMLAASRHGLGRFHDGGGVYPDLRIVEATRRLITDHPTVRIPANNRRLVESATHPAQLHAIEEELGESWQRLAQQVEGDEGAKRTISHLCALEVDKVFGEPGQGFPNDVRIATRLGVQDRLVEFKPPQPGLFGEPLQQLPIRHFLLPEGLDPDIQPSEVIHQDGITEFSLGEAHFRYSRFGLERLKDN
jgi:CRISPR-associated endonuclease/helicase Cas3